MAGEREGSTRPEAGSAEAGQHQTRQRMAASEQAVQQASQHTGALSGARAASPRTRDRQQIARPGPTGSSPLSAGGSAGSESRGNRQEALRNRDRQQIARPGPTSSSPLSAGGSAGSESRGNRQEAPRNRDRASSATSRRAVQDPGEDSQRREVFRTSRERRSPSSTTRPAAAIAEDDLHAAAAQGGLPRREGRRPLPRQESQPPSEPTLTQPGSNGGQQPPLGASGSAKPTTSGTQIGAGPPAVPMSSAKGSVEPGLSVDGPFGARLARAAPSVTGASGAAPSGAAPSEAARVIRLGIETEFLLADRNRQGTSGTTVERFVKDLAEKLNFQKPSSHPRMHELVRENDWTGGYKEWAMGRDSTVKCSEKNKFPLEMVTPILSAASGSPWRDQVKAIWHDLEQQYEITSNKTCSTHVHVSLVPEYRTPDLRRIASAVIQFETAFEALVPETRRVNSHAESNWLESNALAQQSLSRAESIATIGRARNSYEVINLMQSPNSNKFAWNFSCLVSKGTIEFRKPPPSTTADEALSWAELAITFVQASIRCDPSAGLTAYPPHLGGFRSFLETAYEHGVNEPRRWKSLWPSENSKAAVETQPTRDRLMGDQMKKKLDSMMEKDKKIAQAKGAVFNE